MAEDSLTEKKRRCPDCGEQKSLAEFCKSRTRRDGFGTYCLSCSQAAKKRSLSEKHRRCTKCGETKPLSEFKRDRGSRDGAGSWCMACYREWNRVNEAARRAAIARPLCSCGCGEQVKYPGSKYRHGHTRPSVRTVRIPAGATDGTAVPKRYEHASKRRHKTCPKCGQVKPVVEFYQISTIDPYGKPGKRCANACKPCARAATQQHRRNYTDEQRRRMKSRTLMRQYGITLDEYDALAAAQGGACQICRRTNEPLVIDHCHGTNRFRGLICGRCNGALGMVQDSEEIAMGLLDYIRTYCRL
jgi:ribosomal protein S27AE